MQIFKQLLTEDLKKRKTYAVLITILLNIPLILLSIYGLGDYGIALFVFIPFFIGMCSTIILGYKKEISKAQARSIGFLSLSLISLALLAFAIEGIICMIMAAPFALLLTWLGSLIGFSIVDQRPNHAMSSIMFFLILIPLSTYFSTFSIPDVKPVQSKIIIDADLSVVWKNVIAFPTLEEPQEVLFKAGISYPISSEIVGEGVGSVRYCKFNSGDFVEPITRWEENALLAFDVVEQPVPMRELSFWDVHSPHLHDYFVSKKGQFKLTQLEDGRVELEGTTWYYHNIKPDFYWRLWSNYIIYKIHHRVLSHIKAVSEAD